MAALSKAPGPARSLQASFIICGWTGEGRKDELWASPSLGNETRRNHDKKQECECPVKRKYMACDALILQRVLVKQSHVRLFACITGLQS